MEVLKYRKDANSPWQSLIGIKGEKGDKPIKGVDYFTQDEIDEIIDKAAAGGTSGGMTQGDVEALLLEKDYADKDYVDSAITGLNLENTYSTKEDVNAVLNSLNTSYYNKTQVDKLLADLPKAETPDLSGYVTDDELTQAINGIVHPTPDFTGYATESFVTNRLSNYATLDYIAGIKHLTTAEVEAMIEDSLAEIGVAEEGAY